MRSSEVEGGSRRGTSRGVRAAPTETPRRWRERALEVDAHPSTQSGAGDPPAEAAVREIDGPRTELSELERDIGACIHRMATASTPDELRIAAIQRRLHRRFGPRNGRAFAERPAWAWWGSPAIFSLRGATIILVSLLAGGVAAALTGRVVSSWQRARHAGAALLATSTSAKPTTKGQARLKRTAPLDLARQDAASATAPAPVEPNGHDDPSVIGLAGPSGSRVAAAAPSSTGLGSRIAAASSRPIFPAPVRPNARAPSSSSSPSTTASDDTAPRRSLGSFPRRIAMLSRPAEAPASPSSDLPAAPVTRALSAPALVPPPFFPEIVPDPDRAGTGWHARHHRFPVGRSPDDGAHRSTAAPGIAATMRPELPGAESRLLGEGLRRLHVLHDPRGALELLDDRDRRFPRGVFGRQSSLIRAEALIALGYPADALTVMDALPIETSPADRSVSLARAELRAAHARCLEAIGDFDRVLEVDENDASAARALYGRAVCRARGGNLGDARLDFRAYLERFPRGNKRAEAERTLRSLGG